MDLNKSKTKNIKAQLELEPNFPGVATPQSSECIIDIISYTYNPFTAPWGETDNENRNIYRDEKKNIHHGQPLFKPKKALQVNLKIYIL